MTRRPHKSGKSLHVWSVSGLLACIAFVANDRSGVIGEPVCRTHSISAAIRAALKGRILHGMLVPSDDQFFYNSACANLVLEYEVKPHKDKIGDWALEMISACHKSLDDFQHRLNVVATRHPDCYLTWLLWTEQHKGDADRFELVVWKALLSSYEMTDCRIFGEPRFRMGYRDPWASRRLKFLRLLDSDYVFVSIEAYRSVNTCLHKR